VKRLASTSIPGVTILSYWQAPKYTPSGIREIRAIAWHFAQGGGTDTWLTRQDGRQGNNSCHIVVKYDGSIRQIVEFDDAAWSLHNSIDADSHDAPDFGIFAFRYVREALGSGYSDPNRYIIAIEVEGFFDNGPNAAQKRTIRLLAAFLEREYPKAVHLGHRDFQDYKPCPGKYLFTNLLPHASRFSAGEPISGDDPMLSFRVLGPADGTVTIAASRGIVNLLDGQATIPPIRSFDTAARIGLYVPYGDGEGRQTGYLIGYEGAPYIALDAVKENFVPTPVATVDPNPELEAALAAVNEDLEAIRQIVNT
jgi:hypothetical protein